MTLFEWVKARLSVCYKTTDNCSSPTQMFLEIGAPTDFCNIFENLSDQEFSYKKCKDGEIPDLESRSRNQKRKNGQFYTPDILSEQILELSVAQCVPQKGLSILDPACGDGSFLLCAAQKYGVDSVVGYDIDPYALLICFVRLITLFPNCGWPHLELRDFLLEPPNEQFDVIVGNPPYKVNLDENIKTSLRELYNTAEGEKDLYTFFIEASIKSLKPDGFLGIITSHTWLVNHQCTKIREFVFSNSRVQSVRMLPPRFFSFAPSVLPTLLIATGGISEDSIYGIEIYSKYLYELGWLNRFYTESSELIAGTGLRGAITPQSLKDIFLQMEKNGISFGDICQIGVGIQESVKKEGSSSKFVSDIAVDDSYKPVLKGRELSPFHINWEKKYIHFGSHLAYAGNEETYKNPKILYQNIRNEKLKTRLVATVDENGFYFKNSLSYILSKDSRYSLRFLCGIMNSLLLNGWFASKNHSFHITVTQVRKIPLPKYDEKKFCRVESIVSSLMKADEGSKSYDRLMAELNPAVIDCYNLNLSDLSEFCNELTSFLETAAGL